VHHFRKTRWTKIAAVAIGLGLPFGALPASASTIPAGSVQVVVGTSPANSNNKSVRANCPAGKRVLGGGVLTAGGAHVIISETRPISDALGDGYLVTAQEDQFGVAGAWVVQSFAFCADAPPGLQIVATTGPPTSDAVFAIPAQCPPRKFLVGSGGQVTGGVGQVDLGSFPNGGGPFGGLANASTAFAKEDADGFAGTYQVSSFAICASQNVSGDFSVFQAASATDTNPSKSVTVACQTGLRATGAAGFTQFPNGTHVQFAKPSTTTAPSQVEVAATESLPTSEAWSVVGTVFCAK
jgi:hypothetical protein